MGARKRRIHARRLRQTIAQPRIPRRLSLSTEQSRPVTRTAQTAAAKQARPGRTLIVTKAEVFALKDGLESLCALMQQTIMVMHGKGEK